MIEELAANYNAAMAKASKETDTWECPACAHRVQFPGAVHIEWGTPECEPCHKKGDRVLMTLIDIRQNVER